MKAIPKARKPLIAILDDDVQFCKTVRLLLEPDFEVGAFVDEEGLFRSLRHEEPDLLLLDVLLADAGMERNGFEVYEKLRKQEFIFPVVILTVLAGLDVTSRAMSFGLPFLQKDSSFNPDVFRQTVLHVLTNQRLRTELEYRRRNMETNGDPAEWPWADSPVGRKVREQVQPFLQNTLPVFIVGERGTGKRTMAAWIHARTAGSGAPFVVVNPVGQSDEAFEADVFGMLAGPGHTGSGALRSAEGGTVYVEEFDTLPVHILVRLTETTRSCLYSPEGSARRRRLGCRIIGGGVRSLSTNSENSAFGGYWKPLEVHLPPLRDQKEDLDFHLERMVRQLFTGKEVSSVLSRKDQQALAALDLPGNFHDLRMALIRGVRSLVDSSPATAGCEEEWERLAAMTRMKFDNVVLMRYLRGVQKLHGRNSEAWMSHTGSCRAQVFRYFKILKNEDE